MSKETAEVLFLSFLIPDSLKTEIRKKSRNTMQDAAISLQTKIIEGIEENIGTILTLFNLVPVNSFPRYYNDILIKKSAFSHKEGAKDINFGFFNLHLVKQLFEPFFLRKNIKQWAKRNLAKKTYIISYSMNKNFMESIRVAKMANPNIVSCLILADLPEFSNLSEKPRGLISLARKFHLVWNEKRNKKRLSYVDTFVLLTEGMARRMDIRKPYVVMEGIASEDFRISTNDMGEHSNPKTVFYAGTLHKKFGILNLLDAFKLIPHQDFQLLICGIGDSSNAVIEAAKTDVRIKYLQQTSREHVLELMRTATVIVNPRQNDEEFTKYSFPSKNMEALSSGIPLVAYKLDGIPNDYDPYIHYVQGETPTALAEALVNVCNKSDAERAKIGGSAQLYVLKNKNYLSQTKKITEMLEKVYQSKKPI